MDSESFFIWSIGSRSTFQDENNAMQRKRGGFHDIIASYHHGKRLHFVSGGAARIRTGWFFAKFAWLRCRKLCDLRVGWRWNGGVVSFFSSPGKGSKNMWDDFLEESNRIKNIPTQKLTWHWTSPFSMGNTSSFMVDLPSSHVSFPGGTYQKTWYHPWLNNTRAMLRKVVQVDPKPRRLERRRRYPHLQGGRPGGLKSCKLTDGWIRWWWHR